MKITILITKKIILLKKFKSNYNKSNFIISNKNTNFSETSNIDNIDA